jgi:hypothetical protein
MDIDNINEFVNNINDEELNNNFANLRILIANKNNIGLQKLISIQKQINDIFYTIKITDIKNFKKNKSSLYDFSFYGGIKKVLYSLLRDVLVNTTDFCSEQTYYISHTFTRIYPNIEEAESITINKINIVEKYNNNSCVVCYDKYSDKKVEFKLRCNHSICRECFFNIIIRNDYKCPMCRQIMI